MKTICFFAMLMLHVSLFAQAPATPDLRQEHQRFGLRLGFSSLRVLDRNTSSLVYQGNIPTLGLHFDGLYNNNRILGQLQIGRGGFYSQAYPGRIIPFRNEDVYGQIDSVKVPMRATNTVARLAVGYLRQIPGAGAIDYHLGAVVSDDLYYPPGFVQPGLMNVASLSPVVEVNGAAGSRQYFSVRLSIPLLSLVSRSTYNNSVSQPVDGKLTGFLDQGSQWQSVRKHRQIDLSASWEFKVGDRWVSGVHYHVRILKNTVPRDLTMLQNEVGLSFQAVR